MDPPEELVSLLQGLVKKLREESRDQQKQTLTDDTTAVRSFCQAVELILRHSLKERLTFWGERRDYWGYLCEGCAGNKALDPIIKQIQSSTQVTTSQGKGRAFIRRCLSEHLLAECIQTTVSDVKKTRDWYVSGAVLLLPQWSQQVVVALYDLGDVQFHLPLDGLDLDNTWPSFAIKSFQSLQRLPVASPPPQSINTPTRTPSSAPAPKMEVSTPLPYPQPSLPLSPVEQGVESSGESTSSDSGQSSDHHPVTTSPSHFKLPLATPSAATVAMPTDVVRPPPTTPPPPSTPSPSHTSTEAPPTTLSIAELAERSIVEEDGDGGQSPCGRGDVGVVTPSHWETISTLLGAIQATVGHHGNSSDGNRAPPTEDVHISNTDDVVVFLSSLRKRVEGLPSYAAFGILQEEVRLLKGHMRELEEGLREATAKLERSRDEETRLLEALQKEGVACGQLREENVRLREELEVTKATVPLQSDIIIDTPAQAVPNVDGSGDLEVAQLRQQMEQEAILLREVHQRAMKEQDAQHQRAVREQDGQHQRAMREQDAQHQRAMREQDAQHQNAYAVLREKMNEQLGAERRGRKVAEEERDGLVERFHSLKDASESEVSSLKYQLSSQLVALEQSKETCARLDKQLLEMKTSNASLEKQVAEMGAQAALLQKGLTAKTRESELLKQTQLELKATRDELTSLQMEKTATRDKERVESLRFQTELDATKKQLLAEKKESSRLARENEEIRKMFAKLLEQKASLWQLADQLESEHTSSEWMDSDSVNSCMSCKEEFSLLNRKHHCRSCGKVFCHNCCSKKVMLASSKEPVRVCNVCHKKQLNKTSRASEVINTLEESISPNHTNGTALPPTTTSQLIQPQAPPPPLLPIQHGHSTNSLHQMLLSQNSDGHLSERGEGLTGGLLTPPRASDSFIPDQLSSGPSSYTVHPIGRNGRDVPKDVPEEEVGRREGAAPRKADEASMTTRSENVVARRPTDPSPEHSTSGGGGSRPGRAGVVSYSLEDYDGLTKDDSYVVIETQNSGSMFPLGLDSNQGRLDVSALASKLASLEAADRERNLSTPSGRSLSPPSSDFKEVALEGGASHKVTITVDTIGTVVGWEFSSEPKGLAFGITFCRDDRQEEVLPLRRCTSHKATLTGDYVVQKKGKYILNFDNCHSKYSGRQLRYKIWQTLPV